jgi:hypothetical protein
METKIFIAAPISSFENDYEYNNLREKLLDIIDNIKGINSEIKIISELINIKSNTDFENPVISAKKDFNNIKESTHFILIYPRKTVSSALIELGYAIALNKKILIVTPDKETLPYIAQELNLVYDYVELILLEDISNLEKIIFQFII